ncbi:MAG: hypothetical protein GC159_19650 [Phycisphaera sp.]|nr:hypothetical protein [Phycisphaera sp.]
MFAKLTQSLAGSVCGAALALAAVGCETNSPETRIESDPATYSTLEPREKQQVTHGEVEIGFSQPAVRIALGEPDRVSEIKTDAGVTRVVWVYRGSFVRESPSEPREMLGYPQPTGAPPTYVRERYDRIRVVFDGDGRVVAIERNDPR